MQAVFKLVMACATKSVEQGAASSVYCAGAPADVLAWDGALYFVDCKPQVLKTAAAKDQELADALWSKAEQMCAGHLPT